jgi:CDP-diacylglycerol--glycerol-3-phosphate 3-phosphatidyltransferase
VRLAITWLAIWLIAFRLLQPSWPYAVRWLVLSGLLLAGALWLLWRLLPENRRSGGEELLPFLGVANRLSMLRGLLIGLIGGFLFAPWPPGGLAWMIAGLFTIACLADWLDGWVARRSGQATTLGQHLDLELDGLGVAVAVLLGAGFGQLPLWFILVGAARYLFVGGIWWRKRRRMPLYAAPPSVHRRLLAGGLMGFLTVMLWPIVPASMSRLAAVVIGIPVLLSFLRDWLIVSGRLSPASSTYERAKTRAYTLIARRLPLIWRGLLAASMAGILLSSRPWHTPPAWVLLFQSWRLPRPEFLATCWVVLAAICLVLTVIGAAGRLAGLVLLFPIGFDIATHAPAADAPALVSAILLVLFGTGMLSLWRPEDELFNRRGAADQSGDEGVGFQS